MTEKIEIPLSKNKLFLGIGGSILFVVLGIWLFINAVDKVNSPSNTFDVRSSDREGLLNSDFTFGTATTATDDTQLTITKFIKIWSNGSGGSIEDLKLM